MFVVVCSFASDSHVVSHVCCVSASQHVGLLKLSRNSDVFLSTVEPPSALRFNILNKNTVQVTWSPPSSRIQGYRLQVTSDSGECRFSRLRHHTSFTGTSWEQISQAEPRLLSNHRSLESSSHRTKTSSLGLSDKTSTLSSENI